MARGPILILLEKTTQKVKLTIIDKETGNLPLNLSGKTLRFSGKKSVADADADKVFESTVTVTNAANGKAETTVAGANLSKLTDGTWEIAIWNTASPTANQLPDDRIVGTLEITPTVVQGGFTTPVS